MRGYTTRLTLLTIPLASGEKEVSLGMSLGFFSCLLISLCCSLAGSIASSLVHADWLAGWSFSQGCYGNQASRLNRAVIRWRGELVTFLLQPRLDVTLRLRQIRNALGLNVPFVGVHVRHGDACMCDLPTHASPRCTLRPRFERALRHSFPFSEANPFQAPRPCRAAAHSISPHFHFQHLSPLGVSRRRMCLGEMPSW